MGMLEAAAGEHMMNMNVNINVYVTSGVFLQTALHIHPI